MWTKHRVLIYLLRGNRMYGESSSKKKAIYTGWIPLSAKHLFHTNCLFFSRRFFAPDVQTPGSDSTFPKKLAKKLSVSWAKS